jgi:carbamoyl-phosphate synthase large subunit
MKNILVTGVGAVIGYGVINSLRSSKYDVKIIGIDIFPNAVGQNWCDSFEQVLPLEDPGYVNQLEEILIKHKIDLIIPAIEQDVIFWASKGQNVDSKVKVALNNKDLIFKSFDKWLMHQTLLKSNFPAIPTYVEKDFTTSKDLVGIPFLLKPRCSYASKGIVKIYDSADYEYWKEKTKGDFMIQQYIGTDEEEFTAAIFGYGDGNSSRSIIFKRKLSGEGATKSAEVVEIDKIDESINRLVRLFKPIGPTNFQFRKHGDEYFLLEINPRISSSTSIRTSFGYNEAEMCLDFFLNSSKPNPSQVLKGKAVRYIADIIYEISDNF